MRKTFELEWDNALGPAWMNRDNLQACLDSLCKPGLCQVVSWSTDDRNPEKEQPRKKRPTIYRAWHKTGKVMLMVLDLRWSFGFDYIAEAYLVKPSDLPIGGVRFHEFGGDYCKDHVEQKRNIDNLVFMLSTGVPDSNQIESFQSDICKYIDDSGTPQVGVIKRPSSWYLEAINGDAEGNQDIPLVDAYPEGFQIIGNKWEHPELLTKEKG